MRLSELDHLQRRASDARTRARNAAGMLAAIWEAEPSPAARFLVGYEAERLLQGLLGDAETLARLLHVAHPEYDSEADFDTLLASAASVSAALLQQRNSSRRRRLAAKLGDTGQDAGGGRPVPGRRPAYATIVVEGGEMVSMRDKATKQFQIHDGTFGISLYERETGREALLDFFADRARGEIRTLIETDPDTGEAFVTVDGTRYVARELPG